MIKKEMEELAPDGFYIKPEDYFYTLHHVDMEKPFIAKRKHVREFKTVEAVISLLHEFDIQKVELRL